MNVKHLREKGGAKITPSKKKTFKEFARMA